MSKAESIITNEFEIARLQKWIDRKSLIVFDHITKGCPLPEQNESVNNVRTTFGREKGSCSTADRFDAGIGTALQRSGSPIGGVKMIKRDEIDFEKRTVKSEWVTEKQPPIRVQPVVRMQIVPIHHSEANALVAKHHRHHKPTPGHKFSVAVADELGQVRGVAIVGRPVARNLDDGWVLEVNRCCTDGTRNACSMLYQAAWRVAKAMGYRKLITYTIPKEGGASLRGAGWKCLGERWRRQLECEVKAKSKHR